MPFFLLPLVRCFEKTNLGSYINYFLNILSLEVLVLFTGTKIIIQYTCYVYRHDIPENFIRIKLIIYEYIRFNQNPIISQPRSSILSIPFYKVFIYDYVPVIPKLL